MIVDVSPWIFVADASKALNPLPGSQKKHHPRLKIDLRNKSRIQNFKSNRQCLSFHKNFMPLCGPVIYFIITSINCPILF